MSQFNPFQRGQGTTEYVLLLVVIIAIAFLVLNRLFTPVQRWTQFYIGEYIDCLLDQGELPKILGDGDDVVDCRFEGQSLADGGGGSGGGGSGGGQGGSGGSSRENGSSEDQMDGKGKNSSSASVSGDSSAGAGIADRSRGNRLNPSGRRRQIAGPPVADGLMGSSRRFAVGEGSSSHHGEESEGSLSKQKAIRGGKDSFYVPRRRRQSVRVRGLGGWMEQVVEQEERKEKATRKVANLKKEELQGLSFAKARRFQVEQTKSGSQKVADDNFTGFSFGHFIRYLIIILVILIVAWVIGSQVAQVKKNMGS
ncbi:MAG: hypothetical protein NZ480_05805 [Bdellovibrionaceae bacterium]|nr:hypothetical protein [Pseudobdellovibrionaceae bacterium]MDW8190798.1 hypothetical protein [Pseudobdellovibrionaceae bacterium]